MPLADLEDDWRLAARCRTLDPDLFFHPDGERREAREERLRRARKVCGDCPVIAQCRTYAVNTREGFGIWGGTSEQERIKLFIADGQRPRGRGIHRARFESL